MNVQFGEIKRILPEHDLLRHNKVSREEAHQLARQIAREANQAQGPHQNPVAAFYFDTGKPKEGATHSSRYSGYVLATGEDAVILKGMDKTRQAETNSIKAGLLAYAMGQIIFKALGLPQSGPHCLSKKSIEPLDEFSPNVL